MVTAPQTATVWIFKLLLKVHQRLMTSCRRGRGLSSQAAVLQEGLDVLFVPRGRGRRVGADGRNGQSVAGFVGGASLGVIRLPMLGDENGHQERARHRARPEEEGRPGDEQVLAHKQNPTGDLQLWERVWATVCACRPGLWAPLRPKAARRSAPR